jgi:2-dehydropantoate 2-reductase
MSEIKKVGILGAGAMGAYFISRFSTAPGFSACLIADRSRKDKLSKNGLVINGKTCFFPVVCPEEADSPMDLIIVALKHPQLADALAKLSPLVGEDTLFLSVMNGLESEATIAAAFGCEKVLYAISIGIDAVREGNHITFTTPGKHIFGEAENSTLSPKVLRVKRAFETVGVNHEIPVDMKRMLWWKFMINVGVNQASAVLRAPYGVFHTDPDAQALMESLMQEAVTLAQASGVSLTQKDIQDWYPVLRTLSPDGKTSMLQDVEAGRPTEVDVFGGKVLSLGFQLDIPTPVNRTIVQIIKVMEKNY